MKFGGASVATPQHFSHIADLILEMKQKKHRLVVVVSAMGDTTDQLIDLAKQVHPDPPRREYDMLVSVGERISVSLLAMALARKNHEAVSFTGSQSGIITTHDHSEASIVTVKPFRILKCLDQGKVVIVAGFQGVSTAGEITTLGRGGSDTTAVALGVAMNAERVEFFKDVPGIFEDDPKAKPDGRHFPELTYDEALHIVKKGSGVLHARCIDLAKKNNMPLLVRSFIKDGSEKGTRIVEPTGRRSAFPAYEEEPRGS